MPNEDETDPHFRTVEKLAIAELRLERIRYHVKNAKACGQGNPLAYVDAFKEIEKLVL